MPHISVLAHEEEDGHGREDERGRRAQSTDDVRVLERLGRFAERDHDLGAGIGQAVDAVLPDEFPLNVFYEALRKKLAGTIESTRGMTGADI